MLTVLGICLIIGVFAGLLAGLFGIGGGVIFVPALMFCFDIIKVPQNIYMHLVIGTSLSCILITTINSSYAQYRRGNIDWRVFFKLCYGVTIGVVLGSIFASYLSSKTLEVLFTIFLVFVTIKMWMGFQVDPKPRDIKLVWYWIIGGVIGFKSAVLGIGGGTLSVPFLNWTGKKMKEAVGVSSSLGVVISMMGVVTYIFNGWQHPELPTYSLGYIYLPAFVGLALTSSIFAHVGARWADGIEHKKLHYGFSVFILIVLARNVYHLMQ